jgi:UDP-N-acetylglucosamine 2-epimerase (hydrolysing)
MTRHILFLTGTRADYGKLEPLARRLQTEGARISFFVTGMHMIERYGLTKLEVQRLRDVAVHEFMNQRPGDPQDIILAKTISGFSDFVAEARPELIVIHGDRIEALAGAVVAATNYIPSAHIEGGEVSGTIDEAFRHCNTKLCTHHFVSSEQAARRVMALGEPPESIYVIGSPELDFHAGPSGVTLDEVRSRYAIPFPDYGIAVFHPVTSEQANIGEQAHQLFRSLETSSRCFVVIAPNNDPGSEAIFSELALLPNDRFRLLPSMRFAHFSELMKNSACLVGNSSAGVREAPFLGIPSLDVGSRQANRASAPSVFNCAPSDASAIAHFLKHQWGLRHAPDRGFGEGNAADRFAHTLANPGFWARGLQKIFHDVV